MLPKTLALVDDEAEFNEFLTQYLQEQGIKVSAYGSSDDLLADPRAFSFDFYIADLMMPGIDGVDMVRLLRRRTHAGILVVSGRIGASVFESVVNAGADMYLAKPVRFDQVVLAVKAIHRRASMALQQASSWRLDTPARQLIAPDGTRIDLSEGDLVIMACFVDSASETVTRETLRQRLGYPDTEEANNALSATIYRLRRRIERSTPSVMPLQSQSRVGYVFKGTLLAS